MLLGLLGELVLHKPLLDLSAGCGAGYIGRNFIFKILFGLYLELIFYFFKILKKNDIKIFMCMGGVAVIGTELDIARILLNYVIRTTFLGHLDCNFHGLTKGHLVQRVLCRGSILVFVISEQNIWRPVANQF